MIFLATAFTVPLWAISLNSPASQSVKMISTPTCPLRGGATMNMELQAVAEMTYNLIIFNQVNGNVVRTKQFTTAVGSNLVGWDWSKEGIGAGLYYWEIKSVDDGSVKAWGNFAIGKFN